MQLDGVWVRYGRRSPWVLRHVQLTLPVGTLVELTGRNGAGKSSLLRVLAGVLRPGRGSVRGRPPVVDWVPERFPSRQPFTAGQYLLAQARIRGLDARAAGHAVDREVGRLRLAEVLSTPLPELSKGSTQKICLAQALLVPPDLLVLDEPWGGLDGEVRSVVPDIVRKVLADGGSVAVSDHQHQVAALAPHRRWQVEGGAVVEQPRQHADSVVVEVELPSGEATVLLAELRGRGLTPRLR